MEQTESVIFIQKTEACAFTSPLFLGHLHRLLGKNLGVPGVISGCGMTASLVESCSSHHVGGLINEVPPL